MPVIEVDFEVFKALTARRPTENVSENDVLRELLRLPKESTRPLQTDAPSPGDWVTKGVRLPAGTELRATYKGQTHLARVSSGALELGGKRFDSPSAAAMSITGHPVNGWMFWKYRLPGQGKWADLKKLREP
jgi:Restriction Enzyme Adenine Methylase Associated/Protein of unknown function (DUF2924)